MSLSAIPKKQILVALLVVLVLQVRAQSSVLATGEWLKICVQQEGIYRLDFGTLEDYFGSALNSEDVESLKMYGYGGGPLPQINSQSRFTDIPEIGIARIGTEDGSFDPGDHILFYAEPVHKIELTAAGNWQINPNIYSDQNCYFLTIGGSSGKSIAPLEKEVKGGGEIVETFQQYSFVDENSQNRLRSGRKWYSIFTNNISVDVPIQNAAGNALLDIYGSVDSDLFSYFEVSLNGLLVDTLGFQSTPQNTYSIKGVDRNKVMPATLDGDEALVRITARSAGSPENFDTFIDKVIVSYDSPLELTGSSLIFSSAEQFSKDSFSYNVRLDRSAAMVWDVSDPISPYMIPYTEAAGFLSFTAESSTKLKRFAVIGEEGHPVPSRITRLPNQNIRSLSPADGLIITHEDFRTEAERLAGFHRQNDGLDISVVTIEEIYNEFSSGRQDVSALRDAIRHYYLKNRSSFRYTLLFGDASYDYLDYGIRNTNFVPTYQSRNSLDPVLSYASDDYFGFMEDDEGEWLERFEGDHDLEIGIGRLPANRPEDARIMVDKIIRYASSLRINDKWKNQVTYVADDEVNSFLHMEDAEDFSEIFYESRPDLRIKKIYLDDYEQQIIENRERSPAANRDLINTINDGTFLLTYIGHGNEFRLMQETIFDEGDIERLTNQFKMPIFVTATCEFGRFDDPVFTTNGYSAAEQLLTYPDGGAIALLSTARPVFASSNYFVNVAFHNYLFELEEGRLPRLGDIVRKTKNASLRGARNRNFTLLGDPFLTPAFPQLEISFDRINERDFKGTDTLSALEPILIEGSVRDLGGQLLPDFTGKVDIRVLDRITEKETLGQGNPPFSYQVQENIIFQGSASVSQGSFTAAFIVPKNISYRFENGKIEAYAVSEDQKLDASGASRDIQFGGTFGNAAADDTPPSVLMYFNDENFVSGDEIGSSSIFVAKLQDENGINTTGNGPGQDLKLELSSGEVYNLNSYYEAARDTYKDGTVVFPLQDLAPGSYTATLKVYDTYNNLATETVSFVVSDEEKIRLFDLKNYPNPISDNRTSFTFSHDRPGEILDLTLLVYDSKGSVILQTVAETDPETNQVDLRSINLSSSHLENGLYFYKIVLKSRQDGATGEKTGKMIVNNY